MRKKIIDLGMHPYADTFIKENQLSLSEPVYPLECYLNTSDYMVSLGIKTNDDDRYNLYEYSYTSSNSQFSSLFFGGIKNFKATQIIIIGLRNSSSS